MSETDKKPVVAHLENSSGVTAATVNELQEQIDQLAMLTPDEFKKEELKLLRKIDFTLMPMLFCLMVLNYLDRNALAGARVQGIEADLGMVGTDFNVAISVLFAGYICGQLPSNMILSKSRPSIYLSCCVMLWGMVSLSTGFVHNFHQLLAVRVLLGLLEAPFFPGALFILSSWYTKREISFRTAILYLGSLLSGAFSGFIAAGVEANLHMKLGYESWRWVFIIEGAITGAFAILALFVLPDYPATTKRLSVRERAMAVYRLEADTGVRDEGDGTSMMHNLKLALCDWKLWALAVITACKTTASAFTQFMPTVIQTFKFNRINTLLLTAPPYIVAAIFSLILSRLSDRKPERCFHFCIPLMFGMLGFIIAAATTNIAARYFSIFLMLSGLHGNFNILLAWYSGCFPRPRAKRAMAIAIINALGNIAQIWSPYMWPKSDGPKYSTAFITNIVMTGLAICLCITLRFFLGRANAQMDREEAEWQEDEKSVGLDGESGRPTFEKKPRFVL
ncbi:hypothetical protein Rhopal_006290-T1 [Rhodotorula paludigena]|uniref:Major facilitator superfamily (MFS) profile domain-containing protein n=1 Tax=Rhodotorula paludigena TaxID=86838 RepID=A0AAV5GSN2_9BASI|nr:hypothetical protein Rhopal_006290-T1 [Rhodotorula paludigena]